MIYKLTSIKRVIAKVFTDLNLQEGDHRISDMVEWAGEALEKIGAFPSFTTKITGKDNTPILELSNYCAKLPNDFHNLIQLSYSTTPEGPFYPMRYNTGNFDIGNNENINGSLATTNNITYVVTQSYIKTNIESGYLMMAYQAIPTDNEGYPMVPDDAAFIDALYWYITMKLYYPQWVSGQVRDAVYYDARRSWNYYCKQAYGDALMPNTDMLESIKNSWLRLVPEINEHNSGFSTLGQEQIYYNHN